MIRFKDSSSVSVSVSTVISALVGFSKGDEMPVNLVILP